MFHATNGDGASHPAPPGTTYLDRRPPQNLDAERMVISAMLIDNRVIHEVAMILKPGDFYRDAHAAMYRAAVDVYQDGGPVDGTTLHERMTLTGDYARVGDETFDGVLASAPHAASAAYHARIVKEKSVARALIEAHNDGLREAYSNSLTAGQLLQSSERRVFAIGEAEARGETVSAADVAPKTLDIIRRRRNREFTGVPSGLYDLDDVTTGFQPEQLVYVAGRTSMGKTALALTFVHNMTVEAGVPSLYVSLEMSRYELMERLIVMGAGVDGQHARTGRVSDADMAKLERAERAAAAAPLMIDDTPTRDVLQVTANARRLRATSGLGFVVVDYVQLIDGDDRRDSRREQLGKISRRLKALARELKIPVLALAQLNRGPEGREGHRPRKSDLKESGDLEQDADVVILLHRKDYYDPGDHPGEALAIVDKNRNGPTADVSLVFDKPRMHFRNYAPDEGAPY